MSELRIAQLALVVSLAVAFWELLKYVLEGGRVRVRMTPGLLDDYKLQTASTWKNLGKAAAERGGWHVEVAVIDVENLGRTPVTVSGVSLDLGPSKRWQPWQRWSIGPRPLEGHEAVTARAYRLEPFDTVRYLYEVWPVLAPSLGEGPARPLRVRASLRVAGKRRPRRSPWRRGWRVRQGQVSLLSAPLEVGMAAYRAMWRHVQEDSGGRISCIPVALEVRKRFPLDGPAPTREQLEDVLRDKWLPEPPPGLAIVALFMEKDLRPFFRDPAPVPAPAP